MENQLSAEQKCLLSTFKEKPRLLSRIPDLPEACPAASWPAFLREPLDRAIKKLIEGGFIQPAGLEVHLDHYRKKEDLKSLLAAHALPTTGTRADLINQAVSANIPDLLKPEERDTLYVASPKGRTLLDAALKDKNEDYLYKRIMGYLANAIVTGVVGDVAYDLLKGAGQKGVQIVKAKGANTPQEPPAVAKAQGPTKEKASERQRDWSHRDFTEMLPGRVRLEMVAIPGGSFLMGSNKWKDSQPIHKVRLKPFYMGKYQVTQAQWKAVMGNNPSAFKGDDLPVETVSWNDVKEFCKKLSEMTGREYRLPSEAEWEYAARAGSSGDYCFGNDESLLPDYAWFSENSGNQPHPVGQKKPNAWELYDVHGNVWEWCEDFYHDTYKGAPEDGSAWVTGESPYRHLRGGSWLNLQVNARAVFRLSGDPDLRYNHLGFRVVGVVRPPSQ